MFQGGLASASLLPIADTRSIGLSSGSDTVSLGEFAIGGQTMGTQQRYTHYSLYMLFIDEACEGAADFISGSTYIADPL